MGNIVSLNRFGQISFDSSTLRILVIFPRHADLPICLAELADPLAFRLDVSIKWCVALLACLKEVFVVFLSPFRQVELCYLKIGFDRFLSICLYFTACGHLPTG